LLSGESLDKSVRSATDTIQQIGSLPSQVYLGQPAPKGQTTEVQKYAPITQQETPEQQVVNIVGLPFEKLAELNKYISGDNSNEPPSAIRYALGAIPEAILYTVGLGGLAKYGMKAITAPRAAKLSELRTANAEKAGIPQAAPQVGTADTVSMTFGLENKILPPSQVASDRRRKLVADLEAKQAEQFKLDDVLKR
jgi:hypothetical protein